MTSKSNDSDDDDGPSFREMGLDDRLLEAAAVKLAWKEPTDIQKRAIPLIMEGRDVLARGRTGSGKTGAFLIPIIQKVLDCKRLAVGSSEQCVRALIMTPTKELCRQIQNVLKGMLNVIKTAFIKLSLNSEILIMCQLHLHYFQTLYLAVEELSDP